MNKSIPLPQEQRLCSQHLEPIKLYILKHKPGATTGCATCRRIINRKYDLSEKRRKSNLRYSQSEANKKRQKRYQKSEKYKKYQKAYQQSDKYKVWKKIYGKTYRQSEHGRAYQRRYQREWRHTERGREINLASVKKAQAKRMFKLEPRKFTYNHVLGLETDGRISIYHR